MAWAQLDEVKRITQDLCKPEFHGRGYVNQGDVKAAHYIANEFEKIGLTPLDTSFLQAFQFQVNSFPASMEVAYGSKTLTPGKHFVVDANSPSFDGQLVPAIIDTNILKSEIQLQDVFEQVQSEQKNAFLIDTRGLSARRENEIRANLTGLSAYAPVVILTHQKFMWSVGRKQYNNIVITLQDSVYQEGQTLRVNVDAKLIEKYTAYNVIGEVKAKKKTKKTVVFTAHYDHLGRMGAETYFPGANDNASGTAMVIAMAKYFKENPVDYNVVFIAFGGEEAGLVGSKYFVEHPLLKLKKIKFLLNLDIMGSGEEGITVVNGTEHTKAFESLEAINAEHGYLTRIKKRGPTQNSDHYYFSLEGVPSFFIYTMGPNKHYHDIFDTYEELSFKECEDITKLLIRFVELL